MLTPTEKALREVTNHRLKSEIDRFDNTYTVSFYDALKSLPYLRYSPFWTHFYDDYYANTFLTERDTFESLFEFSQGWGRDRHNRILTNDYNALVDGYESDDMRNFHYYRDILYMVVELRGRWVLFVTAEQDNTRAFYVSHGEDVIACLQSTMVLTCDTCDTASLAYSETHYTLPWSEIVNQEIWESIRPDWQPVSERQQLLPAMPEPVHNRPPAKYQIVPDERDDSIEQALYVHGVGLICPQCWAGILHGADTCWPPDLAPVND
jgi:hypothetical protein